MNSSDTAFARLLERRALIEADISEVQAQRAAGEIDAQTAAALEARYHEDLADVESALTPVADAAHDGAQPLHPPAPIADASSLKRFLIGAVAAVTILTTAVWWLADRAFPDPEEEARPVAPQALEVSPADAEAVDGLGLDELAAVVAAHPETNALRLTFADRLLESGRRQEALEEYLVVADSEPTDAESSHALARIGYLAYVTGQADAAVDHLRQSLDRNEDNSEARLFLGLVLLYGFADLEALEYLEEVAEIPDLPDEIRLQVDAALLDARSLASGP